MPTSIDPQPAEDEFECANCGAYFHYELTRCPNCGINLYEPEEETEDRARPNTPGVLRKLKDAFHIIFKKPYAADQVFGDALDASILYNDLLQKVGGDPAVVERLIEHERAQIPQATRKKCLENAIQRWDRDNKI